MIYIENNSLDPAFNLALEEYLLKDRTDMEDVFLLWQDEPTVVVGRNQNTIEEINQAYIKQNGINVVRRLSGGGAVYHDAGNLNFTFIVKDEKRNHFDFPKFTEPIIEVLKEIGITAENQGRNDITIGGRKFSGNAQVRIKNRLLHHGTILFDTAFEEMVACLNVGQEKFASKGVKSVKSRVTNISEHLQKPMSIEAFKQLLLDRIWGQGDHQAIWYDLSEYDYQAIQALKEQKYDTWNWNFGASPRFNVQRSKRYDWGKLDLRISVSKGMIENLTIYGDFFSSDDLEEFIQGFVGTPYEVSAIQRRLDSIPIERYLPNMNSHEWITLLLEE
ncbi:MAG: lipoate--protein ligase [Bacillota bacterium]|nr:lipoate--protein ligase [Bacillota bacterium]